MKIRDLNEYILGETGADYIRENIELISLDDRLLRDLEGKKYCEDVLKFKNNFLGQLTSFANDSYDQIFFEFLQNAKDAGATKFWVYFNSSGGLLMINNGLPFSTYSKKANGKNSDSLMYYLTSQASEKHGDEKASGKYGKGSKLQYNLLVPRNDPNKIRKDSSLRLADAMFDQELAPILFSWSNLSHYKKLLKITDISEFKVADHENEEKHALLCKLFLSYFPALPGQKVKVLGKNNDSEPFNNAVFSQFQLLVIEANESFEGDDIFHEPGTLTYIPAPESVISELKKQQKEIVSGLNQALTVLSRKNAEGENVSELQAIRFQNEVLRAKPHKEISFYGLEHNGQKGREATIFFNENVVPEDLTVSNISKDYFPVSKEVYGLGYILLSKHFNTHSSRQSLQDADNHILIEELTKGFLNEWEQLISKENRAKYISLLNAILISKPNVSNYHLELFQNTLAEKAAENFVSNQGDIVPIVDIVALPKGFRKLDLASIGLEKKHGLNEKLYRILDETWESVDLWQFEQKSLTWILSQADKMKVKSFFESIDQTELNSIIYQLEKENEESIIAVPLIKATDDHFYSISDFLINPQLLLAYPNSGLKELIRAFRKSTTITNSNQIDNIFLDQLKFQNINNKISQVWNIEKVILRIKERFKEETPTIALLRTVYDVFSRVNDKIVLSFLLTGVPYFKNRSGQLLSLSKIIPSGGDYDELLHPLQLANDYDQDVFNRFASNEEVWYEIISENLSKINDQLKNLSDIERITKHLKLLSRLFEINTNDSLHFLSDRNDWIPGQNKNWIPFDSIVATDNMASLTEEDFKRITGILSKTKYNLPHFNCLSLFHSGSFYSDKVQVRKFEDLDLTLSNLDLTDIQLIAKWAEKESMIHKFFNYFKIFKSGESYKLFAEQNVTQVICEDSSLSTIIDGHKHYRTLPAELISVFSKSGIPRIHERTILEKLIVDFPGVKELIPIVSSSDNDIKRHYISNLEQINLDSKSLEKYPDDSLEYLLFKLVQNNEHLIELFKSKLTIDNNPLVDSAYSPTVKIGKCRFKLTNLLNGFDTEEQLDQLIRRFPGLSTFLRQFFSSNNKYDISQLLSDLKSTQLIHEDQFCFILAFKQENPTSPINWNEFPTLLSTNPIKILERLYSEFNKEINFGKYWDISSSTFLPQKQIIPTQKELWLKEETIPQDVAKWADTNDKLEYLKSNLKLQPFVSREEDFRNHLIQGKIKPFQNEQYFQTLRWMTRQSVSFDKESAKELCNHLVNNAQVSYLVILKDWELTDTSFSITTDFSKLKYKIGDQPYIDKLSNSDLNPFEVAFVDHDELSRMHPRLQPLRIERLFDSREIDKKEWSNPKYQEWVKADVNYRYGIYISKEHVPFRYDLIINDHRTELICENEGDFGRNTTTNGKIEVYISKSSLQRNDPMPCILENESELFTSKSEKTDLLLLTRRMYNPNPSLSIQPENPKEGERKPDNPSDKFNGKAGPSYKGGVGNGNVNVAGLKDDDAKKLSKKLELLLEERSVDELLNNLNANKKRKQEATPNLLSGFIGEQLFKAWVTKQKNNDVKWVADVQQSHDLEIDNDRIEVKTKIGTLYDDDRSKRTTVVYFRKSQLDFIEHKSPDISYYLGMISLEDIGIKQEYVNFKSQLRKETKEIPKPLAAQIEHFCRSFMESEENQKRFENEIKYLKVDPGVVNR